MMVYIVKVDQLTDNVYLDKKSAQKRIQRLRKQYMVKPPEDPFYIVPREVSSKRYLVYL